MRDAKKPEIRRAVRAAGINFLKNGNVEGARLGRVNVVRGCVPLCDQIVWLNKDEILAIYRIERQMVGTFCCVGEGALVYIYSGCAEWM